MKVVILSRKPVNAWACINSILTRDPAVKLADFIIVANGDRATWDSWVNDRPEILFREEKFIFSQAANVGINHAGSDVILLNDDTELVSPHGISLLAKSDRHTLTSARVVGPWTYRPDKGFTFCSFFLPRPVYDLVGPLDERFIYYGYEDDDYCRRCVAANVKIRECPECVIQHFHPDRSTFHGPNNYYEGDNLVVYNEKYHIDYKYTWSEHLAQIQNRRATGRGR